MILTLLSAESDKTALRSLVSDVESSCFGYVCDLRVIFRVLHSIRVVGLVARTEDELSAVLAEEERCEIGFNQGAASDLVRSGRT